MEKAILIMDMPDRCDDCDLWDYDSETDLSYCGSWSGRGRIDDTSSKPDWCPLIPEPQKKNIDCVSTKEFFERIGWNACLEALEGKT